VVFPLVKAGKGIRMITRLGGLIADPSSPFFVFEQAESICVHYELLATPVFCFELIRADNPLIERALDFQVLLRLETAL
jgi:hypothetical protein